METVNEGSTHLLRLSFTDESGAAIVPSAATWKIVDAASGTIIKAETAFTPTVATHELVISATENRILNAASAREQRRVTISVTYSGSREMTTEYLYEVNNLADI